MFNIFATFSKLEIIDLVISIPVVLTLILFGIAAGISIWREDKKLMQLIRKFALSEFDRGTKVEKLMRLSLLYIVTTVILAYLGSVYFAMSLGIVAALFTAFSFYYLAVVEQYKEGKHYDTQG